jgi:hypothetical protein
MEGTIAEAEAELIRLQEEMTQPDVVKDYVRLQALMQNVADQEKMIERLYARWEELEAKRAG